MREPKTKNHSTHVRDPEGATHASYINIAGKSTLLRALAVGVYDKVPGDGRELAVTDPGAVTVRAEDGRPVSGVDISPFISSLPSSAAVAAGKATGTATTARSVNGDAVAGSSIEEEVTTGRFSTGGASGSTSQAANVMEALEAGATALLLDEDTCAGNVRDRRGERAPYLLVLVTRLLPTHAS